MRLGVVRALAGSVSLLQARVLRPRQERAARRAVADLCSATARSLRTGVDLATALRHGALSLDEGGLLATDLSQLLDRVAQGAALAGELAGWARRRSWPEVHLAVAACRLGLETGSGLARALDGVATTLHERAEVVQDARSLATQARWSAGVLVLAPPAAGLAMGTLGASSSFLTASPVGRLCLGAGLSLDALGAWWMARLTASVAAEAGA